MPDVRGVVARTEDEIRRTARGHEGTLRISTECYTAYHWLPPVLQKYRAAHPLVDVQIDASATANPSSAVLTGRLDVAIVYLAPRDRRLAVHPLFEDQVVVVVAPNHPLARRPFVRAEDFRTETLFLYAQKEDSHVYQRVLAPAGVAPRVVQRIQLTEAIIELVKAGLGIAVLSAWAVAPYIRSRDLRAVPLTRGGHRRQWSAVTLRETSGIPYIADFIRLVAANPPTRRPVPAVNPVSRIAGRRHA